MLKIATIIASISLVGLLTGCTAGYISPGDGNPTMAEVYHAAVNNASVYNPGQAVTTATATPSQSINHAALPTLTVAPSQKTAVATTLASQFPLLPNPQSQLYIFGHYAGDEQLPVPGHFTVFSLYTRNHYALPGEVMMPYADGQFREVTP